MEYNGRQSEPWGQFEPYNCSPTTPWEKMSTEAQVSLIKDIKDIIKKVSWSFSVLHDWSRCWYCGKKSQKLPENYPSYFYPPNSWVIAFVWHKRCLREVPKLLKEHLGPWATCLISRSEKLI
jgi:hypothetical protein